MLDVDEPPQSELEPRRRWGKLSVGMESEQLIPEEEEGGGHGSTGGTIWGSTFNLCNSAIGAGILALPYAVQQTGVVLGILCMIVMCFILSFTLKMLVWANKMHPSAKSYEKLVLAVFGKRASLVVTFCVILTGFGACTGFLVIIADLLPPIIKIIFDEPHWIHSRISVVLAISIIGILPLASLKNFNSLRFSSTLAIISVTFTVFVIIYNSAKQLPLSTEARAAVKLFNVDAGIFDALPLIGFAFGCHMQLIPIFSELKENHLPRRANMVIVSTNMVCIILYSLTGIFGYLNFPKSSVGNVLKNYPDDDTLVNVARAVLCFVIVCHYPPSNYVCRAALEHLFFPHAKPNTIRRLAWTVGIWAAAFGVSIAIPEIDVVFGLIGATANSLIVFILPALFLAFCNEQRGWEGLRGWSALILGYGIAGIGAIISMTGTVVIIMKNWFPDMMCHVTLCYDGSNE